MTSVYSGVNFNTFIKTLKNDMNARINAFEKYMINVLEKYPEKNIIRTRSQWLAEFKKWSESDDVEKDFLIYIERK